MYARVGVTKRRGEVCSEIAASWVLGQDWMLKTTSEMMMHRQSGRKGGKCEEDRVKEWNSNVMHCR